jgi:hypothetical protein
VSVSTTLTASTSVVTPLVGTNTTTTLQFQVNGTPRWNIDNAAGTLFPQADGTQSVGGPANRIAALFTPSIDSGTTGSLSLKTNNGATQVVVDHAATAVNAIHLLGAATGAISWIGAQGETNSALGIYANGAGTITLGTNGVAGNTQFQVLHTASASRSITVTGSNVGNPTIGVTAGNLAITPSVIVAGPSLSIGTTPALATGFNLPYASTVSSRNNANSGDIFLAFATTVNAVADVVKVGTNSVGTIVQGRSFNGGPNTTDLPAGFFTVWRDTGGATTKLYYNNAGAIQSVALA